MHWGLAQVETPSYSLAHKHKRQHRYLPLLVGNQNLNSGKICFENPENVMTDSPEIELYILHFHYGMALEATWA